MRPLSRARMCIRYAIPPSSEGTEPLSALLVTLIMYRCCALPREGGMRPSSALSLTVSHASAESRVMTSGISPVRLFQPGRVGKGRVVR